MKDKNTVKEIDSTISDREQKKFKKTWQKAKVKFREERQKKEDIKKLKDEIFKKYPKPKVLVKCIDASGYENHFEKGVEYIFKKKSANKELWIVEDMLAEDIDIFLERFVVVQPLLPWELNMNTMTLKFKHKVKMEVCEDCNGEGITMVARCYGGEHHEVDEECWTCKGEGEVEVEVYI